MAVDEFLMSFEWRQARMKALLRHGGRCACCGASAETGAVMNVDHIKPRRTHPELALEQSNLQVLCAACNHGKGNWDTTDWRRPTQSNEFYEQERRRQLEEVRAMAMGGSDA